MDGIFALALSVTLLLLILSRNHHRRVDRLKTAPSLSSFRGTILGGQCILASVTIFVNVVVLTHDLVQLRRISPSLQTSFDFAIDFVFAAMPLGISLLAVGSKANRPCPGRRTSTPAQKLSLVHDEAPPVVTRKRPKLTGSIQSFFTREVNDGTPLPPLIYNDRTGGIV